MDLKQDSVYFSLSPKVEGVVLNRAFISGFFYFLMRVRVSKQERMSVSNLYLNTGRVPPPTRDNNG